MDIHIFHLYMYIHTFHSYMYKYINIRIFQPETILCLTAFGAIEVRFSNKTPRTIEGKVVSIGVELSGAIFTKNLRFNIFCLRLNLQTKFMNYFLVRCTVHMHTYIQFAQEEEENLSS